MSDDSCKIDTLPDELLIQVFSHFPLYEVVSTLSQVCRRWRNLSLAPILWKELSIVDLANDKQKEIWSEKTMSVAEPFVRSLYVSLFFNNGDQCLAEITRINFTELINLTLRDSHFGNNMFLEILEYLVKRNPQLSCLHTKFVACEQMSKYFRIISTITELNKLELIHGGSMLGLRHKCAQCTDEKWKSCLSKYTSVKGEHMREMSLGINRLNDDTLLCVINNCRNLCVLSIDKASTTASCFDNVIQNCNLRKLTLHHVPLNDQTLQAIAAYAPCILSLTLEGDLTNISSQGINYLTKSCRFLKHIRLRNSNDFPPDLSDDALLSMASYCKDIQSIELHAVKNITDTGIESLVENCRQLREIRMIDCGKLTDQSLIAIGNYCRYLRHIEFSGHFTGYLGITSKGLIHILLNLRHLESATFKSLRRLNKIRFYPIKFSEFDDWLCPETTDRNSYGKYTESSFRNPPNLTIEDFTNRLHGQHSHVKFLSFSRCDELNDESLLQVLGYCPDVCQLDVFNCPNLSAEITDKVFKLCKAIPEIKIDGMIHKRLQIENTKC